jgi:hypothetical protein
MSDFNLKTQGDDTFLETRATTEKIRNAPTVTEDELDDAVKRHELRQKIDHLFGNAQKNADANRAHVDQPQQDDANK